MDGLHEATGSLAVWLLIGASLLGAALFKFKYVRNRINIKRQQIHAFHKYVAMALAVVVIVHLFTTKNTNIMLYAGMAMVFIALVTGLLFRIKKLKAQNYNTMVYIKIAVLAVAVVFLTIGHDTAEKHRNEIIKTLEN